MKSIIRIWFLASLRTRDKEMREIDSPAPPTSSCDFPKSLGVSVAEARSLDLAFGGIVLAVVVVEVSILELGFTRELECEAFGCPGPETAFAPEDNRIGDFPGGMALEIVGEMRESGDGTGGTALRAGERTGGRGGARTFVEDGVELDPEAKALVREVEVEVEVTADVVRGGGDVRILVPATRVVDAEAEEADDIVRVREGTLIVLPRGDVGVGVDEGS